MSERVERLACDFDIADTDFEDISSCTDEIDDGIEGDRENKFVVNAREMQTVLFDVFGRNK